MFRAPTMSGTKYRPSAVIMGTAKRNIIAVPWTVKSWSYRSGPTMWLSGRASCRRISPALRPARMKKANEVMM